MPIYSVFILHIDPRLNKGYPPAIYGQVIKPHFYWSSNLIATRDNRDKNDRVLGLKFANEVKKRFPLNIITLVANHTIFKSRQTKKVILTQGL